MIEQRLIQDIKGAEGCRLVAYRDSRGFWTIGYGHYLEQNIDWEGHEISQDVADNLLDMDLEVSERQAHLLPEWNALDTPCRQNAVIELVFNMGPQKWRGFEHTRAAIARKDWDGAAVGLIDSAWAHEVQPDGLTMPDGSERPGRATRLAGYFRTGVYPS